MTFVINFLRSGGCGNPPLQNIIGHLKSFTSKKFGDILWQRSFHDHIIRNEQDYQHIDSLLTNPDYVEEQMAAGKDIILEIEIQGAMKIKELMPIALFIFIEIKRRKQILKNINNNTVIE